MKHIVVFFLMILSAMAFHNAGEALNTATHASLRCANLPRLIPAKEFYARRYYKRWGHQLSPDGKRIAWLERIKDNPTLHVQVLKSGDTVTIDHPVPVIQFHWTLDSRYLLIISMVGRRGSTRLSLSDTDTPQEHPRDLTPFERVNIRSIVIPLARPDAVLVEMSLIETNLRVGLTYNLYEINLETGSHKLQANNSGNTWRWILNDEGGVVGRLQVDANDGWKVQAAAGTANWTTILEGEFWDEIYIGNQVHNRGSKVYAVTNGGRDRRALVALDLNTGEQEVVFQRPDVDVFTVFPEPGAHGPLAVLYHDDLPRYHYFDRKLQADLERILGPGPMLHYILNGSKDKLRLVIQTQTDRTGKSSYLIDRRSGTKKLLSAHPLKGYEDILSPKRPVRMRARDGLSINGYLTMPAGNDGQRLPMVLKVHGGPWIRDYWGFDPETQFLANRGYAVLEVNFRGSSGFGKSFIEEGYGELGAKMQDDLIDAVDWAIAKGYADPDKVVIYGHSYGGYAALVGLTKTPEKFAAGVSVAGISDLASFIDTLHQREIWNLTRWSRFAGDSTNPEVRKELAERSPVTNVHRVARPLLMVHGAEDARVSKDQSDRFVEKLREKDIPVEYIVLRDEGHGIRKNGNRLAFARRLETFLATHLGGCSEQ